jgi:hypothetical protein
MFTILLLILVYIHDAHSLNCIANSLFKISRSELTSSNDSFIIQQISNKTIHSSTTRNLCHVTIFIDYSRPDGYVIIKFGMDTDRTVNYFGIETWFPLVKGNDSIISDVELVCSSHDLCDRIFVENWIHRLANIKYGPLQDELIYLLASNNYSSKCNIGGELTQCSSGMCAAECNGNINNIGVRMGCIDNVSATTTVLYVKIQSIELQPMQYEKLSYICMSDGCNSLSTFERVSMKTANFFDRIRLIMKWLHFRIRIKQSRNQLHKRTQEIIRDSSTRYAITSTNYLSPKVVWSSSIFFILLVFICICCSYLCCRKSKGYTATPTSV